MRLQRKSGLKKAPSIFFTLSLVERNIPRGTPIIPLIIVTAPNTIATLLGSRILEIKQILLKIHFNKKLLNLWEVYQKNVAFWLKITRKTLKRERVHSCSTFDLCVLWEQSYLTFDLGVLRVQPSQWRQDPTRRELQCRTWRRWTPGWREQKSYSDPTRPNPPKKDKRYKTTFLLSIKN